MESVVLEKLNNKESDLDAINPSDGSLLLSLEDQALGACLRPYKDLRNLQK